MQLVRVRSYDFDDAIATDRLYRVNASSYRLHRTHSGEADWPSSEWVDMSDAQALAWLAECPEQLEPLPVNVATLSRRSHRRFTSQAE